MFRCLHTLAPNYLIPRSSYTFPCIFPDELVVFCIQKQITEISQGNFLKLILLLTVDSSCQVIFSKSNKNSIKKTPPF
jgi:hypothetical protein